MSCDMCEHEEDTRPDPLRPDQWSRVTFLVMKAADEWRAKARPDVANEFDDILRAIRSR